MKNIILGFFAGLVIGTCIQAFALSSRSELSQIKLKLADKTASNDEIQRGLELLITLSGS